MRSRQFILPVVGALGFVGILVAERRRPLRPRDGALRREARNLFLGALCSAVIQSVETPICQALGRRVEARRQGLAQQLPMPAVARDAVAFLLLDYTMYVWHVLTHKAPILWRLHLVHHSDLELSATNALRFHMLDMVVSLPWRVAQVRLLGASPRAFVAWQGFFFASVLFHHSNLRLPERLEQRLARALTTPRMHGIHHQAAYDRSNANWSNGLSWWDHLHRTFRLDAPQADVRIGVPAHSEPMGVEALLGLPFARQRDAWASEPDGRTGVEPVKETAS